MFYFLEILQLVPVGDEGVLGVRAVVFPAGIFVAQIAVFKIVPLTTG